MRTIVNMIARMHQRFDFSVITRDHDGRLDRKSYDSVKINSWNSVEKAQVFYLSKDNVKISKIRELINETQPDVIYINSYFAAFSIYLLKLLKLRLIPKVNVILAPCGELSDGALALKTFKKRGFIGFAKACGLYRDVIWKASTDLEKKEIEKVKRKEGRIFVAPDLPPRQLIENYSHLLKPEKKSGEARMVFLARFYPKKNFKWILNLLSSLEGNLRIDIYGPLEDQKYWEECLSIINNLPENIKVNYQGSVPFERAVKILLKYHFFILPTLGENFGHVFLEALAAGCPLIISDKTPWTNLEEKNIGWDISLLNPEKWIETLNYCINLDDAEFLRLSNRARDFAVRWLGDERLERDTLRVLEYALTSASRSSS